MSVCLNPLTFSFITSPYSYFQYRLLPLSLVLFLASTLYHFQKVLILFHVVACQRTTPVKKATGPTRQV